VGGRKRGAKLFFTKIDNAEKGDTPRGKCFLRYSLNQRIHWGQQKGKMNRRNLEKGKKFIKKKGSVGEQR